MGTINLSDQLYLSSVLTLEPRESNVVLSGSMVKVESIWEYLARIDINSRYLGLEVIMLNPPGTYSIDTFLQHIQNNNLRFTKYVFSNITDAGLIPYNYESEGGAFVIIDDLTTGGSTFALSAEQGVVLKGLIDSIESGGTWGNIVGNIQDQTDLIDLVNENSGGGAWGEIEGDIQNQTDLVTFVETSVEAGEQDWGEIQGNIQNQTDLVQELELIKRYNFMT